MTVGPPAVPDARAIVERAHAAGIELSPPAAEALAAHARAVLLANDRLHLTAITQPAAFFERHLGEAFEGPPSCRPRFTACCSTSEAETATPGSHLRSPALGLFRCLQRPRPRRPRFYARRLSQPDSRTGACSKLASIGRWTSRNFPGDRSRDAPMGG